MREHIIARWCDQHSLKDPDAPPVTATRTVAVGLDDDRPRRLDLCPDCFADLVAALVPALEEYGVAPDAAPSPPEAPVAETTRYADPGKCLLCGRSVKYLSTHLGTRHELNAADWVTVDDAGWHCPLCDDPPRESQPGLGRHMAAWHEVRLMHWVAEQWIEHGGTPPTKVTRRRRAAAKQ